MLTTQDKAKIEEAMQKIGSLLHEDRSKDYSSDDLRLLYSLAYALYDAGDYGEAKGVFQRLAAHSPFSQKYWMGLASCWQMEKQHDEALQGWAMASLIDDSDPTPHFHAAECLSLLGNELEGRKAIEACKSRLGDQHLPLQASLEKLEASWKQEHIEGA